MKKITKTLKTWFFIWFLFWFIIPFKGYANLTQSDWLVPLTSWIRHSYYEVKWCSPHAARIPAWNCQKWYFFNKSWVGIMTYKWENFLNWNVKLNTNFLPATRTANIGFVDLFDVSSIEFEWEWIYTIKIVLVDHAYNASIYEFSYKIDKTAPQFKLTWITESHPNIFVDNNLKRLVWFNRNIVKYDSIDEWSNDLNEYTKPFPSKYTLDNPLLRINHTRQNLFVMYFKEQDISHSFQLNVDYSDSYWTHMEWWTNYLSDTKNFSFHKENGDLILSWIANNNTVTLNTANLTSNNSTNSQAIYKLRLYDNTIWRWKSQNLNWLIQWANYSEIIFYAVRDNTKPNMWWNWLDSTDANAIRRLLKFDTNTHVWDDNAGNTSKFISAKNSQSLSSSLSDTWIWTDTSKPELYNAWIPLLWWTKISIQNANNVGIFNDTIVYNNRFTNNIIGNHDFSIVDNNRQNWYRKYNVNFNTTWFTWNDQICDNVWNCLNPQLDFRVVANSLSNNTSNITLGAPNTSFANWYDKYTITTSLKDQFWNAIVWVTAVENGNKVIKTVENTFNFDNKLYPNHISNSPSWPKQAIANVLSPWNYFPLVNTWAINNDSKIVFNEKPENNITTTGTGYWTYSFELSSKVPTSWLYHYLQDSKLKLTSIDPKALEWNTSLVWIYPTDPTLWLWLFDNTTNLNWTDNFLNYNNQFLNNTDYSTDLDETKKSDYWKITLENASGVPYNTLLNRKLELEFASPFIYGWSWFTIHHLINNIWASSDHTKLAYTLNDTNISNKQIVEKYIPSYSSSTTPKFTPNIFNIYSNISSTDSTTFDNSIINQWKTIDINNNPYAVIYKTKSSPINSSYQIAWNSLNMWYVSHLKYLISWTDISIPSISRNISDLTKQNPPNRSSSFYYPEISWIWTWDYVILWDPIINTWILWAMWIAITWLSNNNDSMLIDDTIWKKANLNIWENLTRYDFIKTFKQNIYKNSTWFLGSNKKWCESTSLISINNLNSTIGLEDCTIEINNELISFIKWDINIDCSGWTYNTCTIESNKKRTIIVKGWSTFIKSNISTFWKNSQLLIWTVAEDGLANITIGDWDNPVLNRSNETNGWTFIHPSVTNIDAFIVSQWPMVSYDDDSKLFNAPGNTDLKNQLHIYWSTLSLNTIWWYKSDDDSKCPYIVQWTCNSKTAFIFDLVTLRRYSLEWVWVSSPQLKVSWLGMRSWQKTSYLDTNWNQPPTITTADSCNASIDNLRCIKDKDYIIYPMLVEKDTIWNNSPSIMFKIK